MTELSKQIFVKNSGDLVYTVKSIELHPSAIAYLHLDLVCGYDYVDPDNSDLQGYVGNDKFIEEVQHDMLSCDLLTESITTTLTDNGYRILNELPKIYSKGLGR